MAEAADRPVVLDATVLGNFASSESTAQLARFVDQPVTVDAVRRELERGREGGYGFLKDALDCCGDAIPVVRAEEEASARQSDLRDRLDAGEAAALLVADERAGTLATDDLAARDAASERGIPVTGSVGLLALGVRVGALDVDVANEWLTAWRTRRGYYSPIDRIEELLG